MEHYKLLVTESSFNTRVFILQTFIYFLCCLQENKFYDFLVRKNKLWGDGLIKKEIDIKSHEREIG